MEPEAKKPKVDDGTMKEASTICKRPLKNVTDIDRSAPYSTSIDGQEDVSQNSEHGAAAIPEPQVDGEEADMETREESGTTVGNSSAVCQEVDVGITEYVSQHKGFTGIIKQR